MDDKSDELRRPTEYQVSEEGVEWVNTSPRARMDMAVDAACTLKPLWDLPIESIFCLRDFVEVVYEHSLIQNDLPLNEEQYGHLMRNLHMAVLWARDGFPVYQLTHSLAAALALTEPPKMAEGEEIAVPHLAFSIRLPPGLLPVFGPKGQVWADNIWVHRYQGFHTRSQRVEEFIRWTTEAGAISVWRDRRPGSLYMDDERSYVLNPEKEVPPQEEDSITMDGALRIVRNFCSWLEAEGGIEKVAGRPPKHPKKDKGPRARVIQVGRDVKLGPELRRMATEVILGGSSSAREGWKLRVQHVVAGHWKMQPYGEGLKLRKRIWVEPYWRGPAGEEAWRAVLGGVA